MTDLSPAAFAVVDAFVCVNARKTDPSSNADIAAVLRAAADLVTPDDYKCYTRNLEWDAGMEAQNDEIRENLLAIADELEGSNG